MKSKNNPFNSRQLIFQELFIGTLIYAVVLGFFNDYTSLVYAKSFSTIFFASVALELLTYAAFQVKAAIVGWLQNHQGLVYRMATLMSVWFTMFISKFIFIAVLDLLFGDYIHVSGFFGILLVVACVTIIHKLAYRVFTKLA
jgi:hypothetical protein